MKIKDQPNKEKLGNAWQWLLAKSKWACLAWGLRFVCSNQNIPLLFAFLPVQIEGLWGGSALIKHNGHLSSVDLRDSGGKSLTKPDTDTESTGCRMTGTWGGVGVGTEGKGGGGVGGGGMLLLDAVTPFCSGCCTYSTTPPHAPRPPPYPQILWAAGCRRNLFPALLCVQTQPHCEPRERNLVNSPDTC